MTANTVFEMRIVMKIGCENRKIVGKIGGIGTDHVLMLHFRDLAESLEGRADAQKGKNRCGWFSDARDFSRHRSDGCILR